MAKKEIFYQGLDAIPVIIEDTSLTSPDYFRVTNLPSQLNAGTNVFKFKGNISLFPEGADVYVEILDANGMPIYYEVGIDLESQEQPAVVTIFVNQDTTPGNGSIIICSTLTQSAEGQILDPSEINLRWQVPIYIDVSKRNDAELIFSAVPTVTVTSNYSQVSEINYLDITYSGFDLSKRNKSQIQNAIVLADTNPAATYYYTNDTPVIVLNNDGGSFHWNTPQRGFITSSVAAVINISSSYNKNLIPDTSSINIINQQVSSSIISFTGSANFKASYIAAGTGSHIAFLKEPISYAIANSNDRYYPETATFNNIDVTYTLSKTPDNLYTFENKTQNTYNSVNVNFSKLAPLVGTIAKIRSYYKSSGVGEYILLNETDITQYDTEFGFNTGSLSATYALPTVHKGEKIDFKFEYISPTGFVSKQYTEIKDTTFVGGNSYIAGEDNLITGSLFVASSTGSGVQISGKNNAAAIRSIGYEGFAKAVAGTGRGGFVIYSGSVQPILNASEVYSGVGIELFANTSSYFKYTTSGSGLLDIRTEQFFLGGKNQFISGSGGNIIISSSNFSINQGGNTQMSGDVNANTGIFKNVSITGVIASGSVSSSLNQTKYLLEPWLTGSAELATVAAGGIAIKPLTFINAGTDGYGNTLRGFKLGMFAWTGSCYSYAYDFATNTNTKQGAIDFTGSNSAVSGALFTTNAAIDGWLNEYPANPTSFKKWNAIVGYNTGEYNTNSSGAIITSSIDSIIFNTYNTTSTPTAIPYTVAITSETIKLNDFSVSGSIPLQLQLQARFIDYNQQYMYGTDYDGNQGPKAYDCKFTVEILDIFNNVILQDSRIQQFENEWMDFNIPITALLLQKLSLNYPEYVNQFKIRLSWLVLKHVEASGYYYAPQPKQIRITELRVVRMPTAVGLSASAIKFSDSYLSSITNGTEVQGNLIPVDDALYNLGSSAENITLGDNGTSYVAGVAQKRWNNIYGKNLSADNSLTVGSGIAFSKSGSISSGYQTFAAGEFSHAEGWNSSTNPPIFVRQRFCQSDYINTPGEYWSDWLGVSEVLPNGYPDISLLNIQTLGYNSIPGQFNTIPSPLRDIVICTNAEYTSSFFYSSQVWFYKYTLKTLDINGYQIPYDKDIAGFISLSSNFGKYSHAEGELTKTYGDSSHAKGYATKAIGEYSHAEGEGTTAIGQGSHAEGYKTIATSRSSHAEGYKTNACGDTSHAEGVLTQAYGESSHAEGAITNARANSSHTEGRYTYTHPQAEYSHAEGESTYTKGIGSHAEGFYTSASGDWSHAEGNNTKTLGMYQHVQGQFNQTSSAQSAFIVGNGTSEASRSNLIFASGSQVQVTGSLNVSGSANIKGGVTASLFGTSSWASNAVTASYALNGGSGGSGAGFPYTGNAVITGSLLISGSGLTVSGSLTITGSNTLIGTKTITGSVFITGSKTIIGNNTITGSLNVLGASNFNGTTTIKGSTAVRNIIEDSTISAALTGAGAVVDPLTTRGALIRSWKIPAGSWPSSAGFLKIPSAMFSHAGNSGSGSCRLYIYSLNQLNGSTFLAERSFTPANKFIHIGRTFLLRSNTLVGWNANNDNGADYGNITNDIASYAFDPSVDNYILASGWLQVSTDSIFSQGLCLTN